MKIVTTERIVFDAEEREVKKTWARDWPRIWKDIKKHGGVAILTGTWSGYTSDQRKLAHTQYVPWEHANGMRLRTVVFTDGTTLDIEIRKLTIDELMHEKIVRRAQYDDLVRAARESAEERYEVSGEKPPWYNRD